MSEIETRVAVVKVGVQVCRTYPVGVSEQNLVKGKVIAVEGENIVVTLDDPGRFAMDVQGQRLQKGVSVRDVPRNWVPCL